MATPDYLAMLASLKPKPAAKDGTSVAQKAPVTGAPSVWTQSGGQQSQATSSKIFAKEELASQKYPLSTFIGYTGALGRNSAGKQSLRMEFASSIRSSSSARDAHYADSLARKNQRDAEMTQQQAQQQQGAGFSFFKLT